MEPAHMEMMAKKVQKGRYQFCPNGSHMALFNDPKVYVQDLIKFILNVDRRQYLLNDAQIS
jgi:proline iminopeptidase